MTDGAGGMTLVKQWGADETLVTANKVDDITKIAD